MSNENQDGGPAFPTPRYERGEMYSLGMTLRDYFAAKSLIVVASAYHHAELDFLDSKNFEDAAVAAYQMADAMLKARNQ